MVEHERLRRRRKEDDPRPEEPPPLPEHALLALQRTAGNQAVARLVYDKAQQSVKVPKSYADLKIPWDAKKKFAIDRAPTDKDLTLAALVAKEKDLILGHMQTGLALDTTPTDMVVLADDKLSAEGAAVADKDADAETRRLAKVTARAHARIMSVGTGQKFYGPEDVAGRFVQLPRDYIPQEADLPGADKDLRKTKIPNSKIKGATYWQYACVLIALVKQDGYDAVATLTGEEAPKDLTSAVQQLHAHYVTDGVQYDDGATRMRVMGDWGYSMAFAGKSTWAHLPTWMPFTKGKKYIFDITGHTVKVEALQDIPLGTDITGDIKTYFKTYSEKDNYTKDETTVDVEYVWAK